MANCVEFRHVPLCKESTILDATVHHVIYKPRRACLNPKISSKLWWWDGNERGIVMHNRNKSGTGHSCWFSSSRKPLQLCKGSSTSELLHVFRKENDSIFVKHFVNTRSYPGANTPHPMTLWLLMGNRILEAVTHAMRANRPLQFDSLLPRPD